MLGDEFIALCRATAPLVAAARQQAPALAAQALNLAARNEILFVGTRCGGKTSIAQASPFAHDAPICERGGLLDEDGTRSLYEMERLITAMIRLRKQRWTLPEYQPKALLRAETFWLLRPRFKWVDWSLLAHFNYPLQSFYDALTAAGVSVDAQACFGPKWLSWSTDMQQRFLPGLAFDALQETCNAPTAFEASAKAMGYARAAAKFVNAQTDLLPWLLAIAPDDDKIYSKGQPLAVPYARVVRRFRHLKRHHPNLVLPERLTGPKFIRYLCEAGVCRINNSHYVRFATPYAVGATYLKHCLTTAAIAGTVMT